MMHLAWTVGFALLWASSVDAQDTMGSPATESEVAEEATMEVMEATEVGDEPRRADEDETPPVEADPDCLTKVYCKHVKGMLWVEGTFGPTRLDATKFVNGVIGGTNGNLAPSVVVKGPEFGAAIGAQFDVFSIGVRFKYADFDPFDLLTVGLDFAWLLKFVPFVAPYLRFGLAYATTRNGTFVPGLDPQVDDVTTNGASSYFGAGVRIPVIKWISVAIGFDYSFVGLYAPANGSYTIGGQIAGTFAITVHPI